MKSKNKVVSDRKNIIVGNTITYCNKEHSTQFEHYCVNLHQDKYNHVTYHWNNIPEDILFESGFITDFNTLRLNRKRDNKLNKINSIQEYGLDGIAIEKINKTNIYHGLQMKLWNNKLTGHDLGTFWQILLCRMFPKNDLSKGYLYHSCKLECNVNDDIKNVKKVIANKITDFYENIYPKKEIKNEKIIRDYQLEAINNLNKKWNGVKSLILPCGTGKTFIVCKYLEDKEFKNIFVFSPLRIHAKQFLNEIKLFLPKYNALLADSDNDGNLNINDIKEILNKKSIISTTFKSAKETITSIFDKVKSIENSILIIDEAHNLINNDDLNDIIKKFNKVLFVTATPPTILNDKFESENIFKYSMHDAIKNKYICDYKIYLPLIINDKISINKPNELIKIDDNLCKKGLFIINGMLKTGSKRCIVYLQSIEDCSIFNNIIKKIMKKYHYLPCWTGEISSDVNSKNRCEILKNFQKDEERLDTLKFLCSVHILDEGIDIIKCDSVFITKIGSYTSDIKTVQRICRANRLDKENKNKIASCFMWCDDLSKSINSLQLLKENDIDFIKKIQVINSDYDTQHEQKDIIESNNKNLIEFINVKCLSLNEIWEMKYNLLIEYVEKHKKTPTKKTIEKNIDIYKWFCHQKNKINSDKDDTYIKMSNNNIIKICLNNYLNKKNEQSFEKMLKVLFKYVELNNKIPSCGENYDDVNIYKWYHYQKTKIKNNKDEIYLKMSHNNIIKTHLDKYLNKEKKNFTFEEKMEILFEYVKFNKKAPECKEQYLNINLGSWLQTQKNKITSNKNDKYIKLSKNKIIKNSLDNYLKKEHKKNLTFDEWMNILTKYIIFNNKMPICEEKYENVNLGAWVNHQKMKIISNEDELYKLMSKNQVVKICLDKYLKKEKKLTFEEGLNVLTEYITLNGKIPMYKDKYKNINIASWLSSQKKKIINDNDDLYKKLSSNNKIIKKSLDDYLKKNKKRKLTFDESSELFLKYVNIEHKIPPLELKYENMNIKSWFLNQKNIMKNKEDKFYKTMSKNEIVKKCLDEFLEKKFKQ
jgi:superfamily II DNA or RNA helicase